MPLLKGDTVITIRPGTQAGTQIRLARHGVPRGPRSRGGDMFVLVSVAIPREVSERQRQLLQVRPWLPSKVCLSSHQVELELLPEGMWSSLPA